MAWYERFWNVLRPGRKQRDLERELRFHVTERAEALQAEGMPRDEAALRALLAFGNYTTQLERTRDMDINSWLEALLRNLRQAVRGLAKTPAFTVTVIATLAIGIGANSAVFSAIDAVLLRPSPFPDSNQLVRLAQKTPKREDGFLPPPRLEDWNRLNTTFQAITGYYSEDDPELSGELPEKVTRALIAPRFMKVWGMAPAMGRDFTPEEEHFGGPNAALISDRLWRRRFGASVDVIGKQLRLGRTAYPIVGVMSASFLFPDRQVDIWTPSPMDAPYAQSRATGWFITFGRMKPDVTTQQAAADLATVQANLARAFPKSDAALTPVVQPLKEATVSGVRSSLWMLFGSVSLLLLIACTNIAALLLSRAAQRRHEIAVRFSLGASRASVAAQLLTEMLVLSLAGAGLGLAIAGEASRVFRALAKDLPRVDEIRLDWSIVAYSLACAIAVTLLCGLFPVMRATRGTLSGSLAQSGRSQVSSRNPLQFTLAGVQVALAVTLLAGAGLLLRSFQALGRVAPGFDAEHVLTFHISSSWGETSDRKAARQRVNRVLEAMRAVAGVSDAAASVGLPGLPQQFQSEVGTAEGRAETEPKMIAEIRGVTPSYFATMRIPLLSGETCRDEGDPAGAMVNRSFADAYLGGTAAIGRHLTQGVNWPPTEIRGIVGDARESGMDHEPAPTVYWCYSALQPGTYFLVKTHGDPAAMAETVRRKIHEIEPGRSVYDLTPLAGHISDAFAENRLRTILLAFFAITAVSLACVGLYGTLSYLVSLRQREVGLRLALGAVRTQIVGQFLGQGITVALAGCAAGLALTAIFGRLLSGMLYAVSAWDPLTLVAVVTMVMAVSVLASLLPAIRAARVEPMQVLREQ